VLGRHWSSEQRVPEQRESKQHVAASAAGALPSNVREKCISDQQRKKKMRPHILGRPPTHALPALAPVKLAVTRPPEPWPAVDAASHPPSLRIPHEAAVMIADLELEPQPLLGSPLE
jgi:hypothetical protein